MDTSTVDKVRENRLRRMAHRQGLSLVKSARRDSLATDYGKYMILGPVGTAYGADAKSGLATLDLEETERWLTADRTPFVTHARTALINEILSIAEWRDSRTEDGNDRFHRCADGLRQLAEYIGELPANDLRVGILILILEHPECWEKDGWAYQELKRFRYADQDASMDCETFLTQLAHLAVEFDARAAQLPSSCGRVDFDSLTVAPL